MYICMYYTMYIGRQAYNMTTAETYGPRWPTKMNLFFSLNELVYNIVPTHSTSDNIMIYYEPTGIAMGNRRYLKYSGLGHWKLI